MWHFTKIGHWKKTLAPIMESIGKKGKVILLKEIWISIRTSQVALVVKNLLVSTGDTRDVSLIPGLGRSPGEGIGNPLQHSCLENPMDGGTWYATVHGVAKSWTWLSDFTFTHFPSSGWLAYGSNSILSFLWAPSPAEKLWETRLKQQELKRPLANNSIYGKTQPDCQL